MQIKVIATGSSKLERALRKWGVSFIINDDTLFDVFGKPSVFRNQLNKLSIDLTRIKNIVISHDDWDHISGLWYVLERNKDVVVYICPHFSQKIKDRIKHYNVKIVEVKDFTEITKGIYSTGEMLGNSDGRVIYEQSLVLEADKGPVVMTGCAHQGVINIIEKALARFMGKVELLIGGMHLKDLTKEEVNAVVQKLRSYNIERIAPMHCTGAYASRLMEKSFGDKFIMIKQGTGLTI